jgi:hypothetical protein
MLFSYDESKFYVHKNPKALFDSFERNFGFEALIAVTMKSAIFSAVILCSFFRRPPVFGRDVGGYLSNYTALQPK